MSFGTNSLTLYLRPIEYQPPSSFMGAARFLVCKGIVRDVRQGLRYLNYLEQNKPWDFKGIMSEYYAHVDPPRRIYTKPDYKKYRSTDSNYYGDEEHMWKI